MYRCLKIYCSSSSAMPASNHDRDFLSLPGFEEDWMAETAEDLSGTNNTALVVIKQICVG